MEIFRPKNTVTRITFPIVDADGDTVTGATGLDSETTNWADGSNPGAFADCTNEATEIGSSGIYYLNLTQSEMNFDYIYVQIKTSSSGAKTQHILINTVPQTTINSRASQTSLDTVDDFMDTEVAAIKAKTDQLTFTTSNKVDSTIQAAGDFAQGAADKVWSTATRALTDKVGFALSAAGIQAIWDALTSALTTVNSIGKLLVDNINTTISSRSSQTSLDNLDDYVDTEVAAIKAKTDNLPSDPADASDIASSFSTVNTKLDAIDDYVDTEVAAIKAKTDNLPSDPADASDIAAAFATVNTKLDTIDDFVDTEVSAIKAKTDLLPDGIIKNTAISNFTFFMTSSTDHVSPKTGLAITAERSIDGGAFSACANSATEISAGVYKIDLAASDLNGDVITLKFTGTGADQTTITIKTQT